MRKNSEKGQAILLVVVACGLFMLGALGLAVDGAQLYGHREMAQIAADGAAEAAALDILGGTNTGTNAFGSAGFTCTNGTDARTPCAHARLNGFGLSGSTDQVIVEFPSTVSGVTLASDISPAAVHVRIVRGVRGSLIRLLGASAISNIAATATAAILQVTSPVPILVLHPTLTNALTMKGGGSGTSIQICGGPSQSIQVNSKDPAALLLSGSPTIDLSKAGPADDGKCDSGTGASVGVFGGPSTIATRTGSGPCGTFSGVCLGTTGHYLQPNPPILDPLRKISPPSQPGVLGTTTSLAPGVRDCPLSSSGCTEYTAGYYPNGIGVKNTTAIFDTGLYYIGTAPSSGTFKNVGFGNAANGNIMMCSAFCGSDPTSSSCCDANHGIMVYLSSTGGTINVGANSSASLVGADDSSAYKGILFFVSRTAPSQTHYLGGGGALSLVGTVYATNDISPNDPGNTNFATYQTIQLQGSSGSSTLIQGEIITDSLVMGGGGSITMDLDPNYVLPIDEVALVK